MPYIPVERRGIDPTLEDFVPGLNAGDLNFQLTRVILAYLPTIPAYNDYNEVIGALECCKLELYRRMVVPYEDRKIQENSDVY